MTRILNGNLSTHLQGGTISLCHCWEITLTNGTVIRLTDHDVDLVFLEETFTSASGFDVSMLESGENLSVDNAELRVLLSANNINKADIINGFYDGARVRVFMVNWSDTADYCSLPGGHLSKVKDSDVGVAVFELVSLSTRLNQNVGRVLSPVCDADLGDSRCGINLAAYTVTGSVTTATSRSKFTDSTRAEADAYFAYGKVTWTTGNNAGVVSEVKVFASGQFTLMSPTPSAIQVGDAYSASRGCNRTFSTCRDVFSNVVNFRGHPHVIGDVDLYSGPKQ